MTNADGAVRQVRSGRLDTALVEAAMAAEDAVELAVGETVTLMNSPFHSY